MRLWYVFGAKYSTMSVIHSIPYKIKDKKKDPTPARKGQLAVYKKTVSSWHGILITPFHK